MDEQRGEFVLRKDAVTPKGNGRRLKPISAVSVKRTKSEEFHKESSLVWQQRSEPRMSKSAPTSLFSAASPKSPKVLPITHKKYTADDLMKEGWRRRPPFILDELEQLKSNMEVEEVLSAAQSGAEEERREVWRLNQSLRLRGSVRIRQQPEQVYFSPALPFPSGPNGPPYTLTSNFDPSAGSPLAPASSAASLQVSPEASALSREVSRDMSPAEEDAPLLSSPGDAVKDRIIRNMSVAAQHRLRVLGGAEGRGVLSGAERERAWTTRQLAHSNEIMDRYLTLCLSAHPSTLVDRLGSVSELNLRLSRSQRTHQRLLRHKKEADAYLSPISGDRRVMSKIRALGLGPPPAIKTFGQGGANNCYYIRHG